MPMEMMAGSGDEYRARLLAEGLRLAPGKDARYGLDEYLASCRPLARARAVTRIGWHGGSFVLPNEVFGDSPQERTIYQSAVSLGHAFNVSGSLEDWKREIARRCVGNSRLVLAASTAFAASLIGLTGDESGGVHLVGESSRGKTTTLRVGGSVWGGSATQAGFNRSWRTTSNGLEGVAALHCDALLCLDELSELSPREAGAIAYMLANGTGKSRARRDGSARVAFSWRLLFLSSGEVTISDKIKEDGRQRPSAGQQVRVLDIPADASAGFGLFENLHGAANGQQFADDLRDATQKFYGTAARAFLAEIVRSPAEVTDAVRQSVREFVKTNTPANADGQVRRAVSRFAVIAAAGELASVLGVTGWPEGAASWAAGVCFRAWLDRRGHIGPAELEAGIEKTRHFFALHGEARFSSPTKAIEMADGSSLIEKDRVVSNRAGFRRDGRYYVYPEVYRAEIAVGFDPQALAAALADRGMLLAGKDEKDGKVRFTQSVRGHEGNKVRVYCFTDLVIGEPAEPITTANSTEEAIYGK